jgi:hypothetical protein
MTTAVQLDDQARVDYIRSLAIADLPLDTSRFGRTMVAETDKDSAYVTSGGIVSFVAGLRLQQKEDVLNSTLLAQLAANKAYNREEQTQEWYRKYHEVLENIGWVIAGFDFTRFEATGSKFSIESAVTQLVAAIASQSALLVTQAAMAAIKAISSGSKAFAIWDKSTHNTSNGNFQISPCISSDDNVAMALAAFHFAAETVDSQFLWFSYSSSSVKLYKGGQVVVLNEQIYKRVRQQIIEKLGDKATLYVANLDI